MVVQLRRRIVRQRYIVLHRRDVTEAINLAGATYGNASTLWRKARCESGLNTRSVNSGSSASGLFQFLPSTWNSTPYAGFSIFDPFANALAAGWMHAHGRGGEWVCR
jgi:SLT domain-containing protein